MAHFKAYFDAMTESISNNDAVNMKIRTITLQSDVNEIFGKENVKKQHVFLYKTISAGNFLIFRPIMLYMVGKLICEDFNNV